MVDEGITIHRGDCREILRTLPDQSINCCVTSPPYWGLRDYGIENQIGLEATPEEYVACMVEVFREVHRVLRNDGTLWLNLGDSYNAQQGKQNLDKLADGGGHKISAVRFNLTRKRPDWLKPKELCGVPWRVAFALQADGWYLRADIIWHKPNPMPESVTDRPTKAHEYLFLLSKNEQYYYDAEAIREQAIQPDRVRSDVIGGANGHTVRHSIGSTFTGSKYRNKRSVWTIATEPYPEAHFATFPTALIEPCIKAGSPPGGTVLDPFGGSGTTAQVARALGCRAVLIELNEAYCSLAEKRLCQQVLDFFVQPTTEAGCETL